MTARRRLLAAWLALALVVAQSVVAMHRVLHFHAAGPQRAAATAPAEDWGARLFGHHDSDGACHLFDGQAGHGLVPALAAVPHLLATFWLLPRLAGEALARWAALFDARGPPSPVC